MIALKQGEAIKKAFDVRCKFGAGMLYVTNQRIVFEITKQGVLLDLPYEEVKSYQAINKDTLLLNWEENGKGRFNLEFKIKHANEVEYEIKSANEEYAKAMNMVDVLKHKKSADIQETDFRSGHWNDCYYDPERKMYVATNSLMKGEYPEEKVVITRFGYPAVRGEQGILFLLPTITKSELTEDLVKARALKEIQYLADEPRGNFSHTFPMGFTEDEYRLLMGEDYVPKEEREAYEKYKTMKNPEFVENNKRSIFRIWSKRYRDEDPMFIEKCAEEINKMWLTIDEEQYLAQEDYNDRRIEVKEIDGRLVALGCDFGESVIYRNIDDLKYWIESEKNECEYSARIFGDDEHKDEHSRLKMEYNSTMAKCCERILAYDISDAKKYRDQGFDINCKLGRKVIHYLVPLRVDAAIEYVKELAKSGQIQTAK